MVTLYNVISQDWFIARKDGTEDFIPDELWPETLKVYNQFDVLVMGRKTYETIQSYPPELYESLEALNLRKVVVTSKKDITVKKGYEIMNSPKEAVSISENTLVSSGPTLNNFLLDTGLVDRVILHQVSTKIGGGIPVFDRKYSDSLVLEKEVNLEQAKELTYRVG